MTKTLTPQQQQSVHRRNAIIQYHATGATLDETGRKFGITRERVRQIVTEAGTSRNLSQTWVIRNSEMKQRINKQEIVRLYLNQYSYAEIAKRLGVTKRIVIDVVRESVSDMEKRRRIANKPSRRSYSDEAAIDSIRKAADYLGVQSIGTKRYDRLAIQNGWPRAQTIMIHFGTWNNAITQAGLKPNTSNKAIEDYGGYTEAEIRQALHRVSKIVNRIPTIGEYDKHCRFNEPKSGTIRRHHGNSWIRVIDHYFNEQD